jgi:hypothetical protein
MLKLTKYRSFDDLKASEIALASISPVTGKKFEFRDLMDHANSLRP